MRRSQDIRLKDGNALFYFTYLPWDTGFFEKKSYILDTEKSILNPSTRITDLLKAKLKNSFIAAKLDMPANKNIVYFLQEAGFKYIDTEVTLRYEGGDKKRSISKDNIRVSELIKNENLPYLELGSTFKFSRFHSDINIAKDRADQLWVSYIRNYKPAKLRRMFLAKCDGDIAGIILANQTKNGERTNLFFVSIIEKFRDIGIGSSLIQHCIKAFDGTGLVTEVYEKNIGALNFYKKNGFTNIEKRKTILHRW